MIGIKVTTYKGYDINYNPNSRMFGASPPEDADDEVARAVSQEDVERQLDKIVKFKWHFPVEAFEVHVYGVTKGRITSINPSGRAFIRFTSGGSSSQKIFSYMNLFLVNDHNTALAAKMSELQGERKELEEKAGKLAEQFTDKVTLEYFGIKGEQ